ncbi:hypothetical protein MASR1M66_15160 [Aminivibrio sp.]
MNIQKDVTPGQGGQPVPPGVTVKEQGISPGEKGSGDGRTADRRQPRLSRDIFLWERIEGERERAPSGGDGEGMTVFQGKNLKNGSGHGPVVQHVSGEEEFGRKFHFLPGLIGDGGRCQEETMLLPDAAAW